MLPGVRGSTAPRASKSWSSMLSNSGVSGMSGRDSKIVSMFVKSLVATECMSELKNNRWCEWRQTKLGEQRAKDDILLLRSGFGICGRREAESN